MALSFWSDELYGCWNETVRVIDTDSLSGVTRSYLCNLMSESCQAWKHNNSTELSHYTARPKL